MDLKGPATAVVPAVDFGKLSEISGVGSHLKWLEKALDDEQTTAISPFPLKTRAEISEWMSKYLPRLVSHVKGAASLEALRGGVF